ncbi:hypothetical protein G6L37_06170 [Agrobacterium rubi]|nr:hypothetical protein [Agrobacterium rubi]NTF24947.1 hypothetical protein [Agrobacterium rubi]
MSYSNPARQAKAIKDADRVLEQHVMVDEPVRSFRFHAHNIDRKYDKGRQDHRPGFVTFSPKESVRFAYTSFYAFSLTWTPGHMTIVGDLGTLTLVHYNAMPTLEAACEWLMSPDYGYLLSKAKIEQEFDKEETIEHVWSAMTREVEEMLDGLDEEVADWQRRKPKWRKRDGMTREEYEEDIRYWEEQDPSLDYRFRPSEPPKYIYDRSLWSESERDGWHVPYGMELLYRCWKYFSASYHNVDPDPNSLLTKEGREDLKDTLDGWASEEAKDVIITWIARDLDYDDYYGDYDYPAHAYFQLAAIQHGARMILDQIRSEKPQEMRDAA